MAQNTIQDSEKITQKPKAKSQQLKTNFVHLHNHSEYSLLDGASRISDIISTAKKLGMPAIALTDHGVMYGAVKFYQEALKQGIKPVIGCEVYVAPKSRFDKSAGKNDSPSHLTLLAKNNQGYKNLMKLCSLGFLEGFYYKPRVDLELIKQYNQGIIALSGCLKGILAKPLLAGQENEARQLAKMLQSVFKDDFYIELQNQNLSEQAQLNKLLAGIANEMDIELVATNDSHYVKKGGDIAQDVLLCIQTGSVLEEQDRLKFSTPEFYIKSHEEMKQALGEYPQALDNTLKIAQKCGVRIELGRILLPKYEQPKEYTLESYLEKLCYDKLPQKYSKVNKEIKERLDYELDVIKKTGFAAYFLIVWDFVNYAKKQGIKVGPGRGSAAGSIVSYVLDITTIDPIEHGLLFERFLNPERISMPDIDIDFCYERRNEVIEYVAQKYGQDKVAQIITFGTMAARAATRDAGRVFNIPYGVVDKLAKMIPESVGITIKEALENTTDLKQVYSDDETTRKILDTAAQLEGLSRQDSIHAAGVVIAADEITDHTPIQRKGEGETVTQYTMEDIQKIGLLKMDFLGLRTLTVINNACEIINRNKGLKLDIDNVVLTDEKTFELLRKGETIGIFQLESSGMRALLKDLKPTNFSDVVAILALYRPGPLGSGMVKDFVDRKHGSQSIRHLHQSLEKILQETYGIIVYQEQVMEIASKLANFTMAEADILRKAMSKKEPEVLKKLRAKFVKGASENKINEKVSGRIFDLVSHFAGYGFNKCVVGSTKIVDADTGKIVTVEELYRSGRFVNTLSINDNYKIVKRPVVDCVANGPKPVYRVKTQLGYEIIATGNHPFLTIDGWKELMDLAIGSRVAAPRQLPVFGNSSWPKHQLVVLAGVLAEGNTCHPSGFYYYSQNKTQVDDYISNLENFNNTRASLTQRRGTYEVYAGTGCDAKFKKGNIPWNKLEKDANVPVNGQNPRCGARLWLEQLGLTWKGAKDKFIPEQVFSLNSAALSLFIGRLWSGDGFLVSAEYNKIPFYATSSRKIAKQIQHLLLRFGILSRITEKLFKYRGDKLVGYAVYLQGRESILKFIDIIGCHIVGRDTELQDLKDYYESIKDDRASKDIVPFAIKNIVHREKTLVGASWSQIEHESGLSMKEFVGAVHARKHGFRRSTIERIGNYFGSEELIMHAVSEIYWDRIVEIEQIGIEQTYDLEIQDTHNFVANGLIVHNSHSTAYAAVSFETAYLKAHYPVEFMASLLTSVMDNKDKVVVFVNECRRLSIKVLPPDVNQSERSFTAINETIRFGLSAVRNVGASAIEAIVKARNTKGKFESITDFCQKVDLSVVNKRCLESLIKAGAFDSLGYKRAGLLSVFELAMERGGRRQKDVQKGQFSLFDSHPDGQNETAIFKEDVPDEEMEKGQLLAFEKEMLGLYVSGHPLKGKEKLLSANSDITLLDLKEGRDGSVKRVAGIISHLSTITTRKGDLMAFLDLEDMVSSIEVIVFPSLFQQYRELLAEDKIIALKGKLDKKEEEVKLIALEIEELKKTGAAATVKDDLSLIVRLRAANCHQSTIKRLNQILRDNPGSTPVLFELVENDSLTKLKIGPDLKVNNDNRLLAEIMELLGADSVIQRQQEIKTAS